MQTLALDKGPGGLILSGAGTGTNLAYLTFDGSTPSASNGIVIVATGSPVLLPVGYYSHGAHTLKVIGSAVNTVLNVTQML